MNIIAIHEVTDEVLSKDLSEFDILTFDDGLYSQYLHYKHFLKYQKPMYFFISTALVSFREQSDEVVTSAEAHKDWRERVSLKYFMNWEQIKEIHTNELCHIGGHGCYHFDLRNKSLDEQLRISTNESICMMNDFDDHGVTINSFCYPYNHEAIGYKTYLTKRGINNFFGNNRIRFKDLK